jgi:hypothetical protein
MTRGKPCHMTYARARIVKLNHLQAGTQVCGHVQNKEISSVVTDNT